MKDLKDYTGEELAEILSGEIQKLMVAYGNVTNCMVTLNMVQHELERRKLNDKPSP